MTSLRHEDHALSTGHTFSSLNCSVVVRTLMQPATLSAHLYSQDSRDMKVKPLLCVRATRSPT